MRKALVVLSVVLVAASYAVAQSPQRLLSDTDVKKFVRDFKSMAAELEQMGQTAHLDSGGGGLDAMISGLRSNAAAQDVLRKYGWADGAFQKLTAVFFGYLALKLEQGRLESSGELETALAELERNPQVSPEQKAALKAQITGMTQSMLDAEKAYRAEVHPADLEAVKANEKALDAMFEE